MANIADLKLIQIPEFPKTDTLVGSGPEYVVLTKADGVTYGMLTEDFKAFLGTVQVQVPKALAPTDPAPTLPGVYYPTLTDNVTYANAGNINVNMLEGGDDYGNAVQLMFDGTQWVKVSVPLPIQDVSDLATKEEVSAIKQKTDIITESKNLLNFNNKNLGWAYRAGSGAFVEDAAWNAMPPIFLEAGVYTISGIKTIFAGNLYSSATPSAETRISTISESGSTYLTQVTFTVPSGGAWAGINLTSSSQSIEDTKPMLAQGTNTTWEPYGATIPAGSISGEIPNVVYEQQLEPIVEKTNALKQSPNLIDKSKAISGSYYNFGTGIIATNTAYRRLPPIPVKPSTTYTVSGIDTDFIGNEYKAGTGGAMERVQVIGTNTGQKNKLTFTTSATTEFVGLNINNDNRDSRNTAMLVEGSLEVPYQKYGYGVSDENVFNKKSATYFSYNPTGNAGQGMFTVYTEYSRDSNYYVGYRVSHFLDLTGIRANLWRIAGAKLFMLSDGSMADLGTEIVTAAESESVFKQVGKTDHTGGYHGDEILTDVRFFANGIQITDTASAIPLTPVNKFEYVQKSDMLETDNPVENQICLHDKRTVFGGFAGYTTFNRLTWNQVVQIEEAFISGISCIARSQANYVFSEKFNYLTLNQDGARKLNEIGSRTMFFVGTGFSSEVSSEITKPESFDNEAVLIVFDATVYNKYYRPILSKTTAIGEVWEGSTTVKHFIK